MHFRACSDYNKQIAQKLFEMFHLNPSQFYQGINEESFTTKLWKHNMNKIMKLVVMSLNIICLVKFTSMFINANNLCMVSFKWWKTYLNMFELASNFCNSFWWPCFWEMFDTYTIYIFNWLFINQQTNLQVVLQLWQLIVPIYSRSGEWTSSSTASTRHFARSRIWRNWEQSLLE